MATKTDILDLTLPGAILDYGQGVAAMSDSLRHPTPSGDHVEQTKSIEDRILAKIKADVVARKILGIRLSRQDEAERRVRLRVFSLLAYRSLVQAACQALVEISELAAATCDPQLPPGEAVLAARNVIGKMAVEDVVIARKCDDNPFMRVYLPMKALDWLNGGNASLGFLTPAKLVRKLLPEGFDDDNDTNNDADKDPSAGPIPTVKELQAKISAKVIGLDKQVLSLSSLLVMHLARAKMLREGRDAGLNNSALLLISNSSCGKTWLLQNACKASGCHFASISATAMTSEAYVGGKLDDLFKALVVKARGNVKAARFGIAFTDEWDKKATRFGRDVTTTCLQQEILVPMQGGEFQISGKRGMERPMMFNSVGTFFAFAGAFTGLSELIRKKTGKVSIGFSSGNRTRQQDYVLDAIRDYGYIREWVNRLTAVMFLPDPAIDSLEAAATTTCLDSFNLLVGELGIGMIPDHEAVKRIAEYAMESRTFYRGIKSVWWGIAEEAVSSGERGTLLIGTAEVEMAIAKITSGGTGGKAQPQANADAPSDVVESTEANDSTDLEGAE